MSEEQLKQLLAARSVSEGIARSIHIPDSRDRNDPVYRVLQGLHNWPPVHKSGMLLFRWPVARPYVPVAGS